MNRSDHAPNSLQCSRNQIHRESLRYGNWWESSLEGSSTGHRGGAGLEAPLPSLGLPSLLVFRANISSLSLLPRAKSPPPQELFQALRRLLCLTFMTSRVLGSLHHLPASTTSQAAGSGVETELSLHPSESSTQLLIIFLPCLKRRHCMQLSMERPREEPLEGEVV